MFQNLLKYLPYQTNEKISYQDNQKTENKEKQKYYRKQEFNQHYKTFDLRFEQMKKSTINKNIVKQLTSYTSFFGKKIIKSYKNYQILQSQKPEFQTKQNQIQAFWIGHATVLLSIQRKINIIFDPIFQQRIVPYVGEKRCVKVPCKIQQLPPIDYVLVSHDHFDHCCQKSLRQIYQTQRHQKNNVQFIIGKNSSDLFKFVKKTQDVRQLSWTQSIKQQKKGLDIKITYVPARHWCRRGLNDQNQRLWGGFVVEVKNKKIYFSGDTGNCKQLFSQMKQQFNGFDMCFLPIGAYQPNQLLKAQHINPKQAVQIHKQLGSKLSLGIHWGTFQLSHETPDDVRRDLIKALQSQGVSKNDFRIVNIGGSIKIKINQQIDGKYLQLN